VADRVFYDARGGTRAVGCYSGIVGGQLDVSAAPRP
jgi:hypothetical protein